MPQTSKTHDELHKTKTANTKPKGGNAGALPPLYQLPIIIMRSCTFVKGAETYDRKNRIPGFYKAKI